MPWNIVGHEWAVELLKRDLAQGRVRHAYLFTGPEGVGKRTLVAEFARALLCEGSEPPCGQCRHCKLHARASHPDLLMVAPEVSGKHVRAAKVKIEPVRRLIYDLTLKPVEAQRRVACLVNFGAANDEAQNALLKTLEEPPGSAVMLVTAERAEDLLPTIVSRCEGVALRPLPLATVQDALVLRWDTPRERAEQLAHLSGGRLGWAVRMVQDGSALEARRERMEDLRRLLRGSRVERMAYAERLAQAGSVDRMQETLELWLGFWRDVMLASAGATAPLVNVDCETEIRHLAGTVPPALAEQVLKAIRQTGEWLEKNVNARLALEVMLLDWPRIA